MYADKQCPIRPAPFRPPCRRERLYATLTAWRRTAHEILPAHRGQKLQCPVRQAAASGVLVQRPVRSGTWSDLHRHEHWGELAFMRSGYMVICTELGNYAAPPQRAVWIPPGLTHEWYIPEPSVDNALYIMPHVLPPGPRFQRYHAMEVSPLVRELIHALAPQPCDYESPAPWPGGFPSCSTSSPCSPKWAFPSPCPAIAASSPCGTALLNEPGLPGNNPRMVHAPRHVRTHPCPPVPAPDRGILRALGVSVSACTTPAPSLKRGKASPPWPSTAATPPFPRSSPPSRNSSGARRANSPADAHAAFPPLRHNHLPRPYPKAAVIPPPPRRHHLRALVSQ